MHIQDIIVIAVLLILSAIVLRVIIKNRGKSGCCGNCNGCNHDCSDRDKNK